MANIKNPLLSLDARGTISKAITFVKRRGQNIAEEIPIPKDVKAPAQLAWRHMYQKCAVLWHALSAAEKRDWEALGSVRHMTGFAYWQSQCLRPNPGIYLPLQGGTMSGDIIMAKNRVLQLPLPVDSQEPLTLAYYTANIAPYLYDEGARATHNANQAIADITWSILAFNEERYDSDVIHDNITNNSRLTCKTAGIYIIGVNIAWAGNNAGYRTLAIFKDGNRTIAQLTLPPPDAPPTRQNINTVWHLTVGEYVEVRVYQTSGAPLNITHTDAYSPEFWMQRIGP